MAIERTKLMWTPKARCWPLHSKQNKLPNETDAHWGFGWLQSQHFELPGNARINDWSSRFIWDADVMVDVMFVGSTSTIYYAIYYYLLLLLPQVVLLWLWWVLFLYRSLVLTLLFVTHVSRTVTVVTYTHKNSHRLTLNVFILSLYVTPIFYTLFYPQRSRWRWSLQWLKL